MSAPAFFAADLDREARRALVEGRPDLDGIDFVEVLGNYRREPGSVAGAPQQRTLLVHLLNRPVPTDWDAGRVAVTGGVRADPRVNPVLVEWAFPALAVAGPDGAPNGPLPPGVEPADRMLVLRAVPPRARPRVLVVRTSTSGDWSTYTLSLLGAGGTGPPIGFDGPLSHAPFSFTVDCPSDLDCAVPGALVESLTGSPLQDYLARDYEPLRARLLDRLAVLLPGWHDRNPADPAVMLAELFAWLGDRFAYWQDAVAAEAYLGTARTRTSVRRHARLLDYAVHAGCSARVWLAVHTDTGTTLRAGAPVCDRVAPGEQLLPVEAHEIGASVYETVLDVALTPARNELPLYSWGDPDHVLGTGTTAAFVAFPTAGGDPGLAAGDVLVLADTPGPGAVESGDPAARFAVRLDRVPVIHTDDLRPDHTVLEIRWQREDALPVPLRVSEPGPDGTAVVRAVGLANVVLADHGATVPDEPLIPPRPVPGQPYRPRLARPGLAWAAPAVTSGATGSATATGRPDPRAARAQLVLDDGERPWLPRPDLIGSGRLDAHVVAEPESTGITGLRFGDGVNGRAAAASSTFAATYRLGGGPAGNTGAGRLTAWLRRPDGSPAVDPGAPVRVWNPLPAGGGTDPEPLEQVRQLAPPSLRTQLRAVTSADYALAAETVPGVQRSVARRRWAGSWYAQEVTLDPEADRADDPALTAAVAGLLEVRRMAGVDAELARPVSVPLLIALVGCVLPGYVTGQVEGQLLAELSARRLPDGRLGFFHPDRFTFGQPLYVGDLVSTAMAVPGVAWVDVRRFARLGAPLRASRDAITAGRIDLQSREVLRCDTDPGNPEAGRVEVDLAGGS